MTITREFLQTQIVALRAQCEQNIANANACKGAAQLVELMLAELDKTDAMIIKRNGDLSVVNGDEKA